MVMVFPYPVSHPASITTPAAGASIGLPIGAETSIPSWGRAICRIGWVRIAEKALDNHPCVGMMDGVAASRAVWRDRLSAASLKDEANRFARRINALRLTRTSADLRAAP